ncbi:hypothetical protein H6F78_04660 [Coleofasciculus sp. FACHB-64]|uniref:hypothetical protein n=1 Tax=Cyanophyceae TaxID=3028117 RepID=UPI001686FB6B|nr:MULTISPECIES: hypothetical protein [unclassified Coleofasciculus]MBD1840038.1 hypothetical protein [Coleofasciculus sp. FACHB-501]MBD2044930.1 hypothetical protein [Coleofasciculus sp. FACHB-64]
MQYLCSSKSLAKYGVGSIVGSDRILDEARAIAIFYSWLRSPANPKISHIGFNRCSGLWMA